MADAIPAALVEVADRLRRDLRTRFSGADVRWEPTTDGFWDCTVEGDELWGTLTDDYFDESDWSPKDTEAFLVHIAEHVADNLWPDRLTDPWPRCRAHPGHPLQPRLKDAKAVWMCLRDPRVMIEIGGLGSA
jgi:hypothetical protein